MVEPSPQSQPPAPQGRGITPAKLFLIIVAAIVVGSGITIGVLSLTGDDSKSKDDAGCGILANGNKLCGDDLRSYCASFANTDDAETARVCASVKGPISEDSPSDASDSECAGYDTDSEDYRLCREGNDPNFP